MCRTRMCAPPTLRTWWRPPRTQQQQGGIIWTRGTCLGVHVVYPDLSMACIALGPDRLRPAADTQSHSTKIQTHDGKVRGPTWRRPWCGRRPQDYNEAAVSVSNGEPNFLIWSDTPSSPVSVQRPAEDNKMDRRWLKLDYTATTAEF